MCSVVKRSMHLCARILAQDEGGQDNRRDKRLELPRWEVDDQPWLLALNAEF